MTDTSEAIALLPTGSAPFPVPTPHFPDALHVVVWRNWDFVDANHLAGVLRATPAQITEMALSMGLPSQRAITRDEQRRNYMSILRRNWHLLPYEQLCELLNWDPAKILFSLNEDDFMWMKLGGYKPQCPPVYYKTPDVATAHRVQIIHEIVQTEVGEAIHLPAEPLFGFVDRFKSASLNKSKVSVDGRFQIRMCYPYFLRFGDPLMDAGVNDAPDGYLSMLQELGINTIWFQGVLNTLAPWKLAPELSDGWEERLTNLGQLVERCGKYGIRVMMYLNEPRSMPRSFFDKHPELRGVEETADRSAYSPDTVALCTSTPAVQEFLVNSVRHIFEQVPDLGGIFAITFSENLTNCYSREYDSSKPDEYSLRAMPNTNKKHEVKACPRCQKRGPAVVHAEVLSLLERGMRLAGSKGNLLWYVWSTPDQWIPGIIELLPASAWVMCISEWGKEFTRGDYTGKVNEYSISVIGPSEQSMGQWKLAKSRGLKTVAKIQADTSSEMILVPYVPAVACIAEHVSNLAKAGLDGLMLGWTLGGWPSPNLAVAAQIGHIPQPSIDEAMQSVANQCFEEKVAKRVVHAWNMLSEAYGEFPFDISIAYYAPHSLGPANLLYEKPTGLPATMITFPYDDLDGWRGPYSVETLQRQFEVLAEKWQQGVDALADLCQSDSSPALEDEYRIAEAEGLCFQSAANQIRFVRVREKDRVAATGILKEEIKLARRMFDLVCRDSRLGFEATMQYGYTRFDIVEKILNCSDLLQTMRSLSDEKAVN